MGTHTTHDARTQHSVLSALGVLSAQCTVQSSALTVCVYYCRTFYKAVRVGEELVAQLRSAGGPP